MAGVNRFQLVLLPRIERQLRLKCSELCDAMLPGLVQANRQGDATSRSTASSSSSSSSSLLSRAAELPALLLETQAQKAHVELENRQRTAQLRLQLQEDMERCRATGELVAQLLRTHKRDDRTRVLLAKVQWLVAFAHTMRLQALVLTSQLRVETYPRDRVAVLQATQCVRSSVACNEEHVVQCGWRVTEVAGTTGVVWCGVVWCCVGWSSRPARPERWRSERRWAWRPLTRLFLFSRL